MATSQLIKSIKPKDFHNVVSKLRGFFNSKGFLEVHTQNRLSILAACEDPSTISSFSYAGKVWPLPQTGQMWLEHELLKNPNEKGFYCLSTSYRNEPNPIVGRHDLIFPMFEFELPGGMDELLIMEKELLEYLGFGDQTSFYEGDYKDIAKKYNTDDIDHVVENKIGEDYGNVFFLKNFPNETSPFWNMKQDENRFTNTAKKIDVLLHGVETIGSAERSVNKDEMREQFYNISDGQYANILFGNFTKERVETELNEFLNYDFFDRSGGGIGVTRLINAMKQSNIIE